VGLSGGKQTAFKQATVLADKMITPTAKAIFFITEKFSLTQEYEESNLIPTLFVQ